MTFWLIGPATVTHSPAWAPCHLDGELLASQSLPRIPCSPSSAHQLWTRSLWVTQQTPLPFTVTPPPSDTWITALGKRTSSNCHIPVYFFSLREIFRVILYLLLIANPLYIVTIPVNTLKNSIFVLPTKFLWWKPTSSVWWLWTFYVVLVGSQRVRHDWSDLICMHISDSFGRWRLRCIIRLWAQGSHEWWSRSVISNSVTPWIVAYKAPLSMGLSRQEYWSGLPFPSPGDLPNLGIELRDRTPGLLHWKQMF